jgi:cytochrome c-type biogenesis protein CcmH
MAVFWILATLMLLVALAFVLVPLLRTRAAAGPTAVEANLEVLRGQRRELEADVAAGLLPAEARDEALAELVERAEADLQSREGGAVAGPRKPWAVAGISAVVIPALALATYLALGSPRALDPQAAPQAAATGPAGAMDDAQIVAMVESLAKKVRERPDDAQGWALLARSMAALGRFKESADAYAHLATLVPGDAQVLADWADALGMAQGRTLAGKPYELARQALAIDPAHPKALALAGTAALDAGDFALAKRYWETLARQLPPDSPDAEQVRGVLAEIRGRAAQAGKPLPPGGAVPPVAQGPAASPVPAAPASPAVPAASKPPLPSTAPAASPASTGSTAGKAVSGSVALGPAVSGRVKGTETLFIYARADGGSRMPLAIVRASARELPMKFSLDDTMAMSPQATLSSAAAVRIEARVSASGNATPQPGDLVGSSAVVKPGARDIAIVIDQVLP